MEKVIIKNDVLSVAKQIKQIDSNYILVFNNKNLRFEVYYKNLSNLQVVLPFNALDGRSVRFVAQTKVENSKKLIQEIEEYNKKLEKDKINTIKDKVLENIMG